MATSRCADRIMFAALLAAAAPQLVSAQISGDGFRFGAPVGNWGVRGGFDHAMAGSDVFSFATDQLTLKHRDFSAYTVGATLGFRVRGRYYLTFDVGYSPATGRSEYRGWVDQNNLPIQQTTYFRRAPLTASVKYYLTPPGRSFGRFAWVPARFAPFVGVGAGAMWYRFAQVGDFVDFQTLNVFQDDFESSGWTPTAHAFAGVDMPLGLWFSLTGEARYTWAKAPLGKDFVGFHDIDLSGLSVTTGVSLRL